jgi:hypothetical protein
MPAHGHEPLTAKKIRKERKEKQKMANSKSSGDSGFLCVLRGRSLQSLRLKALERAKDRFNLATCPATIVPFRLQLGLHHGQASLTQA